MSVSRATPNALIIVWTITCFGSVEDLVIGPVFAGRD